MSLVNGCELWGNRSTELGGGGTGTLLMWWLGNKQSPAQRLRMWGNSTRLQQSIFTNKNLQMTLSEGGWEGTYDTCISRPGGPLGLILSVSRVQVSSSVWRHLQMETCLSVNLSGKLLVWSVDLALALLQPLLLSRSNKSLTTTQHSLPESE